MSQQVKKISSKILQLSQIQIKNQNNQFSLKVLERENSIKKNWPSRPYQEYASQ